MTKSKKRKPLELPPQKPSLQSTASSRLDQSNQKVDNQVHNGGMVLGDIEGNINIVGHDDNSRLGLGGKEVKKLFDALFVKIDQQPTLNEDEKTDLKAEIKELRDELAKNDQADESFLMRRLRNIGRMAPDILEVTLATITDPIAGFGLIAKKIAEKTRASAV